MSYLSTVKQQKNRRKSEAQFFVCFLKGIEFENYVVPDISEGEEDQPGHVDQGPVRGEAAAMFAVRLLPVRGHFSDAWPYLTIASMHPCISRF